MIILRFIFFINIYRLIVGKKNMYLHYEFYIMFVHKKKKRSNQINIHFFYRFHLTTLGRASFIVAIKTHWLVDSLQIQTLFKFWAGEYRGGLIENFQINHGLVPEIGFEPQLLKQRETHTTFPKRQSTLLFQDGQKQIFLG